MPRVALVGLVCSLLQSLAPSQGFVDVTSSAGLAGTAPYAMLTLWGGGGCCGDFDRDGDLDLVVSGSPTDPIRHFRNDGTGVFADVTASSGLGLSGLAMTCVAADVDNDGDLDLCLGCHVEPLRLYINDGTGVFTEEAALRGLAGTGTVFCVSFGDYDRDGWLDLYVGNYFVFSESKLFRNTGGGWFSDVTTQAGAGVVGATLSTPFIDYDGDGWPDLFIANDKGANFTPNQMLRNNGDGTFTDVSASINVAYGIDGMGVDFLDAFNDGGMDIVVSDSPPQPVFHVWEGTAYNEYAAALGLVSGHSGWAVNFLDYDDDGWQDLHIVYDLQPNHLYRNPQAPAAALTPWPEVGSAIGVGVSYRQLGVVVGDFNEDGPVDLLEVLALSGNGGVVNPPQGLMLLENQVGGGNWVKVRTEGTVSNRDGIGARIRVHAGGMVQTQSVRTGTGYICGSDLRCHFGLGAVAVVPRIEITWPSGQVQVFENVPANQTLHAVEPSLAATGALTPGSLNTLTLSVPGDAGLGYAMALCLGTEPGIPLSGGRTVPLNLDVLALFTLAPGNALLPQNVGALSAAGTGQSSLIIPPLPSLSGLAFHAAGVTVSPSWPDTIKTILLPLEMAIQ